MIQKVLINISLILLGICANGTFFTLMVTLLVGTVILGYLKNQPKPVLFSQKTPISEDEKQPVTRS